MKYIIDMIEVDTCPEGWTSASVWPGPGLYTVGDEPRYAYVVESETVKIICDGGLLTATPYVEPGETPPAVGFVSESLFLRAIAAASRGEVFE